MLRVHYAGQLYLWRRKTTADARLTWYLHALLTDSHYAKELRMLDLGGVLTRRFRDLRARMRGERLEISRRRSTADSFAQGGATLAIFATYAFLAVGTLRGAITVGGFVLYYQAFQRGQGWLRDALNNLANLYEGSLFLGDLFDFLDLKVSEGAFRLPPTPVDLPASALGPPPAAEGAIVFDRVSYVYPGSTHKALDDVSFASRRASTWPLPARTAPARPRWSSCCAGCIARPRAGSWWTARTCRSGTRPTCASGSR